MRMVQHYVKCRYVRNGHMCYMYKHTHTQEPEEVIAAAAAAAAEAERQKVVHRFGIYII